MVVKRLALLALLVCSAAGLQRTVRAEEASLRNTEDAMSARIDQLDLRINQLEAENAALRRQSGGYVSGGEGCGCGDDYGCAPAGCCDDCCAGCCGPGCSCGFYGGAELFWAQPRWRGFDVLTLTTAPPGPIAAISHTQGFDYDYDPTARFFVGYTGCNGLGVRSSWWEHDDDANTIELTNPALGLLRTPLGVFVAAGNTLVAAQSLELQTWDFEATSCFEACGGNVIAGLGVRYAKSRVNTRDAELTPGGVQVEAANLEESFEGWGPTVSVEFVRPLCFAGVSLYSSLRGSVLIGDEHQNALFFTGATLTDISSLDAEEGLGIAELQIALQYCRCGWFARAGWQAQYWDDLARDDNPPTNVGFPFIGSNNRSDLIVQGFFCTLGAQY